MKIGKTIVFKDSTGAWIKATGEKLEDASDSMCQSIKNLALLLAPELTGALKASGRVEKIEGGSQVTFGGVANGVNVPYAKLRHYVNNKNPHTKYYLENAGNQVSKKGMKSYLK